ncbi:aldehyde dehydrogenase family protein, partial [Rhizobium ruizarguesonis]
IVATSPVNGSMRSKVAPSEASIASAGSVADMTRAANEAAAAFPDWSQTGPGERRRLMNAAADIVEARTSELVAAMT